MSRASTLVLYGNTPLTSPYVFSVFVALEEKGLPFELRQLSLRESQQLTPEYVERSLSNRVPTLEDGDFSIAESSAITEYLEEQYPAPKHAALYPQDLRERARVRMVQALLRSDFMPIREERATDTVFENEPVQPLSPTAQAAVERLYRIATQLLSNGHGTIASTVSIADVDLSMMLQRLLANGDPMPAPLASYAARVWERPSIRKWLLHTHYRR